MERINAILPSRDLNNAVVTLGNFDGVHLGHQRIYDQLILRARALGGQSIVYTFRPHPLKVLHPERDMALITSYEEREARIEDSGVDVLICAPFDREFARWEAREFVENILHKGLHARAVLVGYDYAFGRDRQGNTEFLRAMGKRLGFEVEIIPPVMLDGSIVSSSIIRKAIQGGDVALAGRMLGRAFTLQGMVQQGHCRGKKLGYPTANVALQSELIPQTGVYAVRALLPDQKEPLGGMASLGTNPTFEDKQLSFEVHIFDFDGDLYGKQLRVAFVDRLRDETRFPSAPALVDQLRKDEEDSRALLHRKSG